MLKNENSIPTLWTKDFTIITVGSVISMIGNSLSGFAMSLLVLDYTKSNLLYALYLIIYTAPQIFAPVISGAVLDRFSRKKTIYVLDFISAFIYVVLAIMIGSKNFNFVILALFSFVMGIISSMYAVAYSSFYPMLITEGFYSQAYSLSCIVETISSLMIPVSAFVYNSIGMLPLLIADAISFFLAAVLETKIEAGEDYIEERSTNQKTTVKTLFTDVKEGFNYLWVEKGLLMVAVYFGVSSISQGVSQVVSLPYFKRTYLNGEYYYSIIGTMGVIGRAAAGLYWYHHKIPSKRRFPLAMLAYSVISLVEAFYLFTPIPVMMIAFFCTGLMGVTSFTIRSSSTQAYVPNDKKGRFNGAFNMLSTVGCLIGEGIAGVLAMFFSERLILTSFLLMTFASAWVLIYGHRKDVKKVYDIEQ